ncbi:MAG: hypothetical protein V3W14_05830 [Candidatus Neomarinimicrobiota bacterium]
MELLFNADVTSAALRLDIRNAGKERPAGKPEGNEAGVLSSVRHLQIETYDFSGQLTLVQDRGETLLDLYLRLRRTITEQVSRWAPPAILPDKSGMPLGQADEGRPLDGLPAQLVPGLPDYWNRENTARRIFGLAMMGYQEDMDQAAFADQASAMIKQAYREVRTELGREFPQLVLDTRDTVLQALEQFKGGTSPDSISFDRPD